MSADAKLWPADDFGIYWQGICDKMVTPTLPQYSLSETLEAIELVMGGQRMRWFVHTYADGKLGLRGYVS